MDHSSKADPAREAPGLVVHVVVTLPAARSIERVAEVVAELPQEPVVLAAVVRADVHVTHHDYAVLMVLRQGESEHLRPR